MTAHWARQEWARQHWADAFWFGLLDIITPALPFIDARVQVVQIPVSASVPMPLAAAIAVAPFDGDVVSPGRTDPVDAADKISELQS